MKNPDDGGIGVPPRLVYCRTAAIATGIVGIDGDTALIEIPVK